MNENEIITDINHPALIQLMQITGGQLGRKLQPPPGAVEIPNKPKKQRKLRATS